MPRRFTSLGTDGFGRSDTREVLRRYFEVDAAHMVVAVLHGLAAEGRLPAATVGRGHRPLRHRSRRAPTPGRPESGLSGCEARAGALLRWPDLATLPVGGEPMRTHLLIDDPLALADRDGPRPAGPPGAGLPVALRPEGAAGRRPRRRHHRRHGPRGAGRRVQRQAGPPPVPPVDGRRGSRSVCRRRRHLRRRRRRHLDLRPTTARSCSPTSRRSPASAIRRRASSSPSSASSSASGRRAGRRRPAPFGEPGSFRSVADIDSPEALGQGPPVQAADEGRGQGQARPSPGEPDRPDGAPGPETLGPGRPPAVPLHAGPARPRAVRRGMHRGRGRHGPAPRETARRRAV